MIGVETAGVVEVGIVIAVVGVAILGKIEITAAKMHPNENGTNENSL